MNDIEQFALSSHQMFELEKSYILNDKQGLHFMHKVGKAVYNHIFENHTKCKNYYSLRHWK